MPILRQKSKSRTKLAFPNLLFCTSPNLSSCDD